MAHAKSLLEKKRELRELPGLTKRRAAEMRICLGGLNA